MLAKTRISGFFCAFIHIAMGRMRSRYLVPYLIHLNNLENFKAIVQDHHAFLSSGRSHISSVGYAKGAIWPCMSRRLN